MPLPRSHFASAIALTVVLAACALAGCERARERPGEGGAGAELVLRGIEAFSQHRLGDMEAVLDSAVRRRGIRGEDRATAEQLLALLAWRYRGDERRAHAHYRRALRAGALRSRTHAGIARMEREAGRSAEAWEAAERALDAAESRGDSAAALVELARTAVEPALEARLGGHPLAPGERGAVERALRRLEPLVRAEPGLLEPARVQLTAALLLDDGPAALAAWRSYFLSVRYDSAGVLAGPRRALEAVLPAWRGPRASTAERRALALALAGSRLFPEAALVAVGDPRVGGDPEVRAAAAWADFTREAREAADSYYRSTALGRGRPDSLRSALSDAARRLWDVLRPGEPAPAFGIERFRREVERRFGAVADLGTTAGYYDLHMGHAVVDREQVVEQYGRRARLRYVALDEMVSNGFQTWAWDGESAHGGWADPDVIYEVRSARAGIPVRAWAALADPKERARQAERIARDSAEDWRRAARDPYAFLPGMRWRLQRDAAGRIAARLRARGLRGAALREAFVAEYERAVLESDIFGHEGRHAIDQRVHAAKNGADSEFRAKLSEVAFAPEPRLSLANLVHPNLGDRTPHGQAGLRFMRGLEAWMRAHAAEVRGLDPARPLLPQAPLLGDAQLRAAARSMDPFAAPGAP
ncbi:MAG TPA: hypothetical protein VF746_05775 [Longimicrobium sp.]|jgi:hypothetical protein